MDTAHVKLKDSADGLKIEEQHPPYSSAESNEKTKDLKELKIVGDEDQ